MSRVPEPDKQYQKVYYKKTGDDGKEYIVLLNLHSIDALDAVARSPHLYSWKHDGFARQAPKVKAEPVKLDQVTGPSGGKPAIAGGVGAVGLVDPATGELIPRDAA